MILSTQFALTALAIISAGSQVCAAPVEASTARSLRRAVTGSTTGGKKQTSTELKSAQNKRPDVCSRTYGFTLSKSTASEIQPNARHRRSSTKPHNESSIKKIQFTLKPEESHVPALTGSYYTCALGTSQNSQTNPLANFPKPGNWALKTWHTAPTQEHLKLETDALALFDNLGARGTITSGGGVQGSALVVTRGIGASIVNNPKALANVDGLIKPAARYVQGMAKKGWLPAYPDIDSVFADAEGQKVTDFVHYAHGFLKAGGGRPSKKGGFTGFTTDLAQIEWVMHGLSGWAKHLSKRAPGGEGADGHARRVGGPGKGKGKGKGSAERTDATPKVPRQGKGGEGKGQ